MLFARLLRAREGEYTPSPNAANLYKNTLAALLFAGVLYALGGSLPEGERIPILLVSGFLGFALGDTLYFSALPRAGVQTTAVVCQIHTPAVVLLDWLVYDDMLPQRSLLCIPLVVAGVLLVVFDRGDRQVNWTMRAQGIACAAAAAVVMALAVVLGGKGMETGADTGPSALWGGTVVRMVGGILGSLLLAGLWSAWAAARRQANATRAVTELALPWTNKSLAKGLLIAAFFGSIMGLPLYHLALRDLPSGAAAALFATTPLFTLPLGFFFGERHGWKAWLGTLLGFVGVVLLVLSLDQA